MAKSAEQLEAEAKIAAAKNRTSLDVVERRGLWSALGELKVQESTILVKKAQATADYKAKMIKAAADYQRARDSGAKGEKMRALVALSKLMVEAPIKYADAAFGPNRSLLARVADTINTSPGATNEDAKRRIAWETYLKYEVPGAGPVFGTFQEMVNTYGDPAKSVSPNDDNGRLWDNLEAIKQKNEIERTEASRFEDGLRFVQDTGAAYEKYLEDTGKPDSPQTAEEFYRAFGMDNKLPSIDDTKLVKTLSSLAENPDALSGEMFRGDFDEALASNRANQAALQGMVKSPEDEEEADTFRDKLAAWVGRPETRWWAEQRGFNIGETYPLTDELKAEIDAGKYPGAVYTKYGVYIPRKDDMAALNAALRDTKRDPARNLFRAAGIGQGGGAPVEIDIKEGADKATIVETGGYDGGLLGRLDNGQFVGSKDGKEWKPLPGDAGERLLASGVTLTPDSDGIQVPVEPTTRTVLGIYRRPTYQDSVGSVRYVDTETGKEVYVEPEKVAAVRYPGKQPAEARRPEVAEAIRTAASRRAMNKSGFSPEDVKPTPPVPGVAAKPLAPVPSAEERTFKEVQGAAQQAEKVSADMQANIDSRQKAEREAFKKLQEELAAEPPAAVQPQSAQTTVSPTVTPTAGMDPRKRLFRSPYATRPE